MKYILEYVGTAAKANQFGENDTVEIEGTIEVDADFEDYGRVAGIVKKSGAILKTLKKEDLAYKAVLKVAKKNLTLICEKKDLEQFIKDEVSNNEGWLMSLGGKKKAKEKDLIDYNAEKDRIAKMSEQMLAIWQAPKAEKAKGPAAK